ncbi:peptidase inhibitor family I36 protein [Streptomyces sp. E11-3]|uniref:peptidase inhibitor family I36 protein n=1 Tax=Streptomyces sp. E11-3 TaxID=3110112 RepID=UPI00397F9057
MRKVIAGLAVFAASASFALVNAAPAAAAPSCPKGSVCVWDGTNFRGGRYSWSGNDSNWHNNYWNNGSGKVANDDSSWYNNGYAQTDYDHVRVYDYNSYSGRMTLCLHYGPGTEVSSNSGANNDGQSHRWGGEC